MSIQVIEGALRLAAERRDAEDEFLRVQDGVDRLFLNHRAGVLEKQFIDEVAGVLRIDSSLAAEAVGSLRSRNVAFKDWSTGLLSPISSAVVE